jgi:hypothetical protein
VGALSDDGPVNFAKICGVEPIGALVSSPLKDQIFRTSLAHRLLNVVQGSQ